MIFVDTSAWFAAFVPSDPNHQEADAFLSSVAPISLITTDYVLDETLTLFKARGEARRGRELGQRILDQEFCTLEWVEPDVVLRGWAVFDSFHDKDWSFTDCVSRAVIERLKIAEAFAFDQHFRQFGNVIVVPQ